jgi:hypothetical protein
VNPYNPHTNILAVIRELHHRYGTASFPAAENAGPALCEDHFGNRSIAARETRADLGALASTTASAEIDDPMIVARIARSWTGASLIAGEPRTGQLTLSLGPVCMPATVRPTAL